MKTTKEIQQEWEKAKLHEQIKCEEQGKTQAASKYAACTMFKGTEDLNGMIDLMFTAQGMEFCTRAGFPSMEVFEQFKQTEPDTLKKRGIYVNCGRISLCDPINAFLIGNTSADIKTQQTALNRIVCLHGAKATIIAGGYSVVKTAADAKSWISHTEIEHGRVL
ncbi:hypothetical protein EVA_06619 [gut metagenome]|uniref:Uncharacterized protein n=1 Tax=gut metagenome TaxID=749906 RepID=J9GRQ9_9ZZZZ